MPDYFICVVYSNFLDIDECLSKPCINGECSNWPGTYQCVCNDDDVIGKNCDKSEYVVEQPQKSERLTTYACFGQT